MNKGKKTHMILGLIISTGFLLRVPLLFWGFPNEVDTFCTDIWQACYNGDEPDAYMPLINFNNLISRMKHEYYYLGYGLTSAALLKLYLNLTFTFLNFFSIAYNPDLFTWFTYRLTNLVFATVSIYLLFLLVKMITKSKPTAYLSALMLALAPAHIIASPIAKPTMQMSFLLLLNTYILFKIISTKRYRNFIMLGYFSALLFGTKPNSIFFLLIPFLLVVAQKISLRHFGVYLITSCLITSLLYPQFLAIPSLTINFFKNEQALWMPQQQHFFSLSMLNHFRHTTNLAIGLPIFQFGLLSLFLALLKKNLYILLISIFIICDYLFWKTNLRHEFVAITTPLWIALGSSIISLSMQNKRLRPVLVAVLIILVYNQSLITKFRISMPLADQRTLAAKYILETIPPTSSIAFARENQFNHEWRFPRLDSQNYQVVDMLQQPDYLIASSIEISLFQKALVSNRLNKANTWDPQHYNDWHNRQPPEPELFIFYRQLLTPQSSSYQLINSFTYNLPPKYQNLQLLHAHPEIYIYKKNTKSF